MFSLLKETKNCQVCKKSFQNGRALGGHMTSHTRKLSTPNAESATGSIIPSLKPSTKLGANFGLHETVLIRSVQTSEVGVGPKQELKREESGQQITGKKKIAVDLNEVDSTEPRSEYTADEEVALCLVAMSKGQRPENSQHWNAIDRFLATPGKEEYTGRHIEIDSDDNEKEGKYKYVAELLASTVTNLAQDNEEEEEGDDDETYLVAKEKQCKTKFMCDTCGKVLHLSQALGGHRTSHRNKRLKICDKNDQAVFRRYECEICGKAFESGQALGGHKKVHYVFLQPIN